MRAVPAVDGNVHDVTRGVVAVAAQQPMVATLRRDDLGQDADVDRAQGVDHRGAPGAERAEPEAVAQADVLVRSWVDPDRATGVAVGAARARAHHLVGHKPACGESSSGSAWTSSATSRPVSAVRATAETSSRPAATTARSSGWRWLTTASRRRNDSKVPRSTGANGIGGADHALLAVLGHQHQGGDREGVVGAVIGEGPRGERCPSPRRGSPRSSPGPARSRTRGQLRDHRNVLGGGQPDSHPATPLGQLGSASARSTPPNQQPLRRCS